MSARLVKVAVLGNCQARSLAAALEAHAEVETTTVTWAAVADETEAAQLLERLAAFDVVISQPYKRFQELFHQDVAGLLFANAQAFTPVRKEVKDYKIHFFGGQPFYGVSIAK